MFSRIGCSICYRYNTLIPAKSKKRYEIVYKYFEEWMEVKKIREVSEKVVLAYFAEQSEKLKPNGAVWS
jgi:hypothetical protein